jgi:hypothetical protein
MESTAPKQYNTDMTKYYQPYGGMKPSFCNGNAKIVVAMTIITILIMVIIYYYHTAIYTKISSYYITPPAKDKPKPSPFRTRFTPKNSLVAQLADAGWVLYTMSGCGYCTKQLSVLGVSAYPKQVHCGGGKSVGGSLTETQGTKMCSDVPGFPHWVNTQTGQSKGGMQSVETLHSWIS